MTKKDYIVIARAIKEAKNGDKSIKGLEAIERVQQNFIVALAAENEKFDIRKFCHACL